MQRNKRITDDQFRSKMYRLLIPIVIQNVLSAAVSSADVVMLKFVGQSSISAVSLAANYANIMNMVYYGLGTGATLMCAQYFGKRDFAAIRAVEGIALRFSLVLSVLLASMAFLFPDALMRIFTADAELIAIILRSGTRQCWALELA